MLIVRVFKYDPLTTSLSYDRISLMFVDYLRFSVSGWATALFVFSGTLEAI